jgi:N,N'-diacetyllegionaminate synthase
MNASQPTFIIAEAGVNHDGSIDTALSLVAEAGRAGADCIKFQTFQAKKLLTRTAAKAEYQKQATSDDESQYEMIRKLELSEADHRVLIERCRESGIEFLSSPFDEESADLLESLGVSCFKVPSGEVTNLPFLKHLARKHKPLIVSTGMCILGEVEAALNTIRSVGNDHITLLHCVTEYPAPFGQINLRVMQTLARAFGLPVGYSDHTPGIEVAVAAVALGARVIEKHFTLDKNMKGPDHRASLEPHELKQMIEAIRNVEASLGTGIKTPAACEIANQAIARKSLVAARSIQKGSRLVPTDIAVKRPGHGIQPQDIDKVIGLEINHDLETDEVITWESFK